MINSLRGFVLIVFYIGTEESCKADEIVISMHNTMNKALRQNENPRANYPGVKAKGVWHTPLVVTH